MSTVLLCEYGVQYYYVSTEYNIVFSFFLLFPASLVFFSVIKYSIFSRLLESCHGGFCWKPQATLIESYCTVYSTCGQAFNLMSLKISEENKGLGIQASVFPANRSFFVIERAKERFAREKERIAPVALFLRWKGSIPNPEKI